MPTKSKKAPAADMLKKAFRAYGGLSLVALATTAVLRHTGEQVNTFMWVRSVLLPVIAVLFYALTVSAARGSYKAFDKIRTLTVIMPIAIIGIDLIPGVCPKWYAVMQAVCMLPVIAAAIIARTKKS
jgi:hypothetical protein